MSTAYSKTQQTHHLVHSQQTDTANCQPCT